MLGFSLVQKYDSWITNKPLYSIYLVARKKGIEGPEILVYQYCKQTKQKHIYKQVNNTIHIGIEYIMEILDTKSSGHSVPFLLEPRFIGYIVIQLSYFYTIEKPRICNLISNASINSTPQNSSIYTSNSNIHPQVIIL